MNILDMKRGDTAVVLRVLHGESVRERLRALGVCTGAKIRLEKVSLFKKTYLLRVEGTRVALGRDVAAGVRVWTTR